MGSKNYMRYSVLGKRDQVANSAGKVSGLRGATLSGPSQQLLPVQAHGPEGRPPHVIDRHTTTMGYASRSLN